MYRGVGKTGCFTWFIGKMQHNEHKWTLKACVLHAVGDLRYNEAKKPSPGRNEVLVKIKASGICGSDIQRVFDKGTYHFPTIPGHEFAGQVVEIGEGVNPEYIGRNAAVFPLVPCMRCDMCQVGEYAQCKDYNYFGSRCDGGFAEYIAVPVWNLVMVPDSLSYEEAAMAEPSAVAIHALRRAGIEIDDNIAIFGAGPIGLMLGQWAKAWGAGKVMLVDIDESKVAFAEKLGFKYVLNSNNGNPAVWIGKITGGRGADLAVEGTGVSSALEQCLCCVRPFGKIIAMGNPTSEMRISQKAYWELLRKQLKISGTWNSSFVSLPKNDWKLALDAMVHGSINVKPFITHRFPLEKCNEALSMMKNRTEFFNKVMFIMQ
jgi:L-iditol 2-dehydrogenase